MGDSGAANTLLDNVSKEPIFEEVLSEFGLQVCISDEKVKVVILKGMDKLTIYIKIFTSFGTGIFLKSPSRASL